MLVQTRIEARPRSAGNLSQFGWEADGAIVNGLCTFVLVAVGAFAALHQSTLKAPTAVVDALKQIRLVYKKHQSGDERLLSGLLASAAARKINRSIEDPLLLSEELMRHGMSTETCCRNILKLYKQKTLATPALQLSAKLEACTLRFMLGNKIAPAFKSKFASAIITFGWEGGPYNLELLLSPGLVLGAAFTESICPLWRTLCTQTAEGQVLAHELITRCFSLTSRRLTPQAFACAVAAAGIFRNLREAFFAQLLLDAEAVAELVNDLSDSPAFQSELAGLSDTEPPLGAADTSAVLQTVLRVLPRLRHAREASERRRSEAARSISGTTATHDAEIQDIGATNLYTAILLDSTRYKEAQTKIQGENQTAQ